MSKKLQGTIYTLLHLANQMDLFFRAAMELNLKAKEWNPVISESDQTMTLDKVAIPACTNNIFILAVSFLDEWHEYFTPNKLPDYANRIKKVKKITKPAFRRIAKWKGLREGRNIILAHNLRIKGHDIFTTHEKYDLIFPFYNSEVSLLHDLIWIISQEILDEFADIEIDINRSILDGINFKSEHIDSKLEVETLFEEIAAIKRQEFDKERGKKY